MISNPQILIITNERSELSNRLMLWLADLNVLRLNQEDEISKFYLDLSDGLDIVLEYKDNSKYLLNFKNPPENSTNPIVFIYQGILNFSHAYNHPYFKYESKKTSISIQKILLSLSTSIGALPEDYNFKLTTLFWAKELGLKIPESEVFNSFSLLNKNRKLDNHITKPITNVFKEQTKEEFLLGPGTVRVEKEYMNRDDVFSPSIVQKEIKKKFEVRTVFFVNRFYSMAIFSQSDKNTSVDFRNYDFSNPNRCIPFVLPTEIKNKLKKLIEKLELKFCSIDLIVDKNNEFVFIEINPEGQIGWVSTNCNYNIERDIANHLKIKYERQIGKGN